MVEKLPNIGKDMDIQIQKAQKNTSKTNPKIIQRQIMAKLSKAKDKKRILKTREKQLIISKGMTIRLSIKFSAEVLQAKRGGVIYPNRVEKIFPDTSF